MFFPEGTRNDKKVLLPFKKGPFFLAIATQSPIQPIVVSHYNFLDHKKRTVKSGELKLVCIYQNKKTVIIWLLIGKTFIKILPEISTQGLKNKDLPILLEEVQKTMQEEYEQLSGNSL
jgi:lysophosphatidate acyltransferase